jgi:hypothetical protein
MRSIHTLLQLAIHFLTSLVHFLLYYLDLMSTASTSFLPLYPDEEAPPSRAPTSPPFTPEPTEDGTTSDSAPAAYVSPIKKKRKKISVYTQSDEEVWELEDAVIVGE